MGASWEKNQLFLWEGVGREGGGGVLCSCLTFWDQNPKWLSAKKQGKVLNIMGVFSEKNRLSGAGDLEYFMHLW